MGEMTAEDYESIDRALRELRPRGWRQLALSRPGEESVRPERFADRLDPSTYESDDEVVGIYERDPNEHDALWCSGRLFRRLTTIGHAYELPTLPLLDGSADLSLNRTRCVSLVDEIAFVAERVNDDVLRALAQSLSDYVATRVRRPAWLGDITFDFD
jgi:hypothetical protein